MKKILLVKTSSIGDVVHNLPVASDIRLSIPGARIDWVVEEPFAAIPRLHHAIARVIPVAIRRWRKTLWRRETRDEVRDFLRLLRASCYDAVIDTQGLLKSALISRAAQGLRYGLNWRSAREPLGLLYDRTFNVPWTVHAVERNRSLAAQALRYALPAQVDYGIRAVPGEFSWLTADRYVVLLHATSAERKLWGEANWIELGRHFMKQGIVCVLPWGNLTERARSDRLAEQIAGAIVPPALGLGEATALLAGAHAVIGVDTGLVHLAAALGTPTAGIYCVTDPDATGIYACPRALNLGAEGKPPVVAEVIAALERILA
jgi:heptosyltransferase-1